MSPRTKEQFEVMRESRKELIRSRALILFANEGFHTTSISMIAKKARISKGLIYNYYESKEELLRDVIETGLSRIMETIDPDRDGIMTDEEMIGLIEINKRSLIADRRFWTLYFSILTQPSVLEIVKDQVKEMYDAMIEMFRDYFERKGFEDPLTEAFMLGSIMDGIFFHYIIKPDRFPIDKVIARLINLYSNE